MYDSSSINYKKHLETAVVKDGVLEVGELDTYDLDLRNGVMEKPNFPLMSINFIFCVICSLFGLLQFNLRFLRESNLWHNHSQICRQSWDDTEWPEMKGKTVDRFSYITDDTNEDSDSSEQDPSTEVPTEQLISDDAVPASES
ncbi:hypothetical protein RYX36_016987 [Vicia faba]